MANNFSLEEIIKRLKSLFFTGNEFLVKKNESLNPVEDLFGLKIPKVDKQKLLNLLILKLKECREKCKPLTVLIVEVDYFEKHIETFGIEAGNKLIDSIKSVIGKGTRDSDLCFCDKQGKFIILLPLANQEEVISIASRIRDIVTKQGYAPYEGTEQVKIKLTVSIGIAAARCQEADDQAEARQVIERALEALIGAKDQGINQINYS